MTGLIRRTGLAVLMAAAVFVVEGGAKAADPAPHPSRPQVGVASWYGPGFHGRFTASGDRFDQHGLTAAHRHLPLGTLARVTNLANGRQVIVEINDRGPFKNSRVLDVSRGAAQKLEMVGGGLARVRIDVVELPDSVVARDDGDVSDVIEQGVYPAP